MRKLMEQQMVLCEIPISEIEIDLNSRDEIPKLIMEYHQALQKKLLIN